MQRKWQTALCHWLCRAGHQAETSASYCLCSVFHIFYLSFLLCIWCRDMHIFDNDQPISPRLSKRKWDNHHVAWYYWEGRLDLLKKRWHFMVTFMLCKYRNRQIEEITWQKIPFQVTGEAGNLQIWALHKNAVEEGGFLLTVPASLKKKKETTLSAALHQPFLPPCFLLSTHLVPWQCH